MAALLEPHPQALPDCGLGDGNVKWMTGRDQRVRMRGGRALRGRARVPVDLDVAQRALLFAALGDGRSQLQGLLDAESFASSLQAWRALGVPCREEPGAVTVDGVGLDGLREWSTQDFAVALVHFENGASLVLYAMPYFLIASAAFSSLAHRP